MPEHTDTLLSGDVIKINNFDLPHKGDVTKSIWCIFLGMDSIFDCPIIVYFCRTTTQKDDFQPGGKRENHEYKKFSKGQYGFEDDCLLDYCERAYADITKEKFNSYIIEKRGRLPDNIIREIWNKCIQKYLNQPQKKSIRDSFAKANITIKQKT